MLEERIEALEKAVTALTEALNNNQSKMVEVIGVVIEKTGTEMPPAKKPKQKKAKKPKETPPAEKPEEEPEEAGEVTLAMVRGLGRKIIKEKSKDALLEALEKLDVPTVTALPEDRYEEAYNHFKTVLK